MTTLPDGAVQVFAARARFSTLDQNGFVAAGSAVYVTNQLITCTLTPNVETGVDLVQLNAAADIVAHFKHGDMPKYYDVAIQLATNDAIVTAMLTGGTVLTDSTAALTAPTIPTAVAYTTLGTLPSLTYGYTTTGYNQYGETVASPEVTAAVTGPTGAVLVTPVFPTGAVGVVLYGRTPGGEQLMVKIPAIGSQATSAASGTGTPPSLAVTALTKPIPPGYQFTIAGDTNTPKIVFTTTTAVGVGATAVAVTESQTITTTIAPGAIQPVFFDTGTVVPLGRPPIVNTTAGPGGDLGYQASPLAVVGNPNGVGIELWAPMTLNGTQASYLPYNWWVVPGCRNLRHDARKFDATMQLPNFMGQAFENPNWGAGPAGDWNFDSSRVFQYIRAGADTLPAAGLSTAPATF